MKRIRPAPMGRAFRIVKRTAHLTVQVSERPVHVSAPIPTGGPDAPKRPRGAKPKASPRLPEGLRRSGARSGRCPEEDGGGEERPCEEGERRGGSRTTPAHEVLNGQKVHIRTDSGSASTRRGGRAGSPTRTTRSCSTRI